MKIRRKIAIIFTILTSIVLLCSFSFIYYITDKYTENDFYTRLFEKANFVAQKYFEEDELSKPDYVTIVEKNIRMLPEAHEIIINVSNTKAISDSLKNIFPAPLIRTLINGKSVKIRDHERQYVGYYYPDNQGTFLVVISAVDKIGIKKQKLLLDVLLCIFFGSLLFIFLIGQFYARRVLLPVGHILKNVRNIRSTNLSMRLTESNGNDELAELIRMFNQMLDRLEDSFSMQKSFISNASHELKNPLTAILGETELALSKPRSNEAYVASLNNIMNEAERLNMLTRNLLSLAQADFDLSSMKRAPVRLDEIMWEIADYYTKTNDISRLDIRFDEQITKNADILILNGIESLLRIALTNLIDNALKFSGTQKVEVFFTSEKGLVKIIITDKGVGIPLNEQVNLFQPFFRASNSFNFKGSGIGLSLAHKVVQLHNGTIRFFSEAGKGTRVEVVFIIR
jgi:signal transduction histidine kinase